MSTPVAIVTGAGSGIGLAVATHLCSKGYKVVIADLSVDSGTAAAQNLSENATFIHCDVSDYASQARLYVRRGNFNINRCLIDRAN
jgi:15-hydroxyprostaglandin dehydrogenase (NAD)